MLFYLNTILVVTGFASLDIALLITIGLLLLFVVTVVLRLRRKKKKKSTQEDVPPVTEILGNTPERVSELNKSIEPFGFAYDPYQDVFHSMMYPWQRNLGYCRLYDETAALISMIIDCEPITFEYNGRRWLIEFWKGQYGMNTGGEVGIYYTTGLDLNIPGIFNGTFYYCVKDEDCINMSFALRKNGNLLFTRIGYHWWLTGFKLGEFSDPADLSMDIILDLYDAEMTYAFTTALLKTGYKEGEYVVQGNRVIIRYDKPHSNQPITRNAAIDYLMQQNNESLCDSYQFLTRNYTNTLDKLELARKASPEMYAQILSIGKPKAVFEAFDTIKNHL